MSVRDGHVEIEPVSVPMRLVEREGVTVAEPDIPLPTLSSEQVRELLEQSRR